jgi:collagenase-like PrtC family protease
MDNHSRPINKIELLAPAGSLATLKAAVASGADAVYLGLSKFNARTFAKNFDKTDFEEAIKICKSNNIKLYLTANTLVKNSETGEFLEQIKYAYEQGVDGVIIQDPSFIHIIKESFPELKIHLSTQAGVMNSSHANLFSGIESVNIAREITKENIALLRKNFDKKLEMFIHGALCACVSGSCLFSSFLGGRSGNRGKCAQPCRKLYNNVFLLSTKELSLIEKIPEIIKLGIDSLKIEGRMRTPYYVSAVVSNYRKAIDSYYRGNFKVTNQMKEELKDAFSREFTEGKFSDEFIFNLKQASGTFNNKQQFYDVRIKSLNLKKRKAKGIIISKNKKESSGKKLVVRIYSKEQAKIAENYADILCLDMFHKDFSGIKEESKKPLYAYTPRIMFDSDLGLIQKRVKELSPDGIIAGNLGILSMNLGLPIILDYNSNCFNDLQIKYYQEKKAKPMISPELSLEEVKDFNNKDFFIFVHGKIRLMTLAHNIQENLIQDEKGFCFHIKKIFNGVEVLNDKELGLFNKIRDLIKSGINQIYIDTEKIEDYEEIIKSYRLILDGKTPDTSKFQKNYVLGWSKQGVL